MVKLTDIQIRDPFILTVPEENRYYLYGTTDPSPWEGDGIGFDAYYSSDLNFWEGPFPAFRPPEGFWADRNFWAPEVHKWNGRYYMFASFKSNSMERATQILASDKPLGPYKPHGDETITPTGWECLDGTLYIEGNKPWLVFCREWLQVCDGEIYAIPLSIDLTTTIGKPQLLFRASEAGWSKPFKHEEKICRVTDGPFLFSEGKSLQMLWSSHGTHGYSMGIATSESGTILGPWTQDEQPVFSKDGGHGMLFTTLKGQLTLSIHQPNTTPLERPIFIPWSGLKLDLNNT